MKPATQKAVKKTVKENYLTTRMLVRAANSAVRDAAEETLKIMGYNVVVMNGWVVKKYADGKVERIEKLQPVTQPAKSLLDRLQ